MSTPAAPPPALAPADAAFVQETFDEALSLVEAARDHIAGGAVRSDGGDMTPALRMRAAQELSRLTNRATAAMSLLLLVKAVEAGQDVGVADVAAQAGAILADIQGPPPVPVPVTEPLPPGLSHLMARGEALFARLPRVHDALGTLLQPS